MYHSSAKLMTFSVHTGSDTSGYYKCFVIDHFGA